MHREETEDQYQRYIFSRGPTFTGLIQLTTCSDQELEVTGGVILVRLGAGGVSLGASDRPTADQ